MCTGACIVSAAQHWVRRALGRVLTPLLLGLRRLLLWCRNHLKYGALRCVCYTYAYEIMSAAQRCNYFTLTGKPRGLSAPKWRTVLRTILPTHQRQPRLWNKYLILPADCPATLGGPFAVHVFNPPETTTSLDKILDSTADCPRPSGRPSVVQSCEPPPETSSLDKLQVSTADRPLPYSGLSAVNSAKPPETTSSLNKT